MRDHTKLKAFELADEVDLLIYRATREFPKEDMNVKFLAENQKLWKPRRFWAPCFDQFADSEGFGN